MKKFFSILAAVLFAGSMMATDFTLSSADEVTQDGITVTFSKGSGSNAPAWYDNGLRLYAKNEVTLTSTTPIASINFNWEKQGTKAFAEATASEGTYTHPSAAGVGAWTGSATSVTFTLGASGQLLLNTFSVTLEGGSTEPTQEYYLVGSVIGWEAKAAYKLKANSAQAGEYMIEYTAAANEGLKVLGVKGEEKTWYKDGTGNEYIVNEAGDYTVYFRPEGNSDWGYTYFELVKKVAPVIDTLTCAAAAEAAAAGSTDEVYVKGYVTSIAYAWSKGSMSFYMADTKEGGNVFEAYKCAIANEEDAVRVGDLVVAHGNLTKYNTTYELAAGCTVEILERAEVVDPINLGEKTIAEFIALKNTKDTCILTGIVSNIVNTTYGNFDLTDETATVYVYGLLTPEGESKKFESLNVAEGDTLTVKAVYSLYNNNVQAKNAIFVSVKKAPVPEGDTIDVTINSITTPGALIWTDAVASEGWWQMMGGNENYEFSLSNVSTTETAGVYTIDDLDSDYSYITVMTATDTTDVYFVDGSVTVAISETGVVTIVGALVGDDGNTYNFDLTYVDPKAEKTVNVTISNGDLYDGYASSGLYAVYGIADDNTAYVQLGIWANTFSGNFTEEDLDLQYIGSYVEDATGYNQIYTAAITVTPGNGEGVYSITADLLCYNNTLYKVTMKIGVAQGEGVDNIDAAVEAIKRLVNGNVVIEKAGKTYNMNGAVVR